MLKENGFTLYENVYIDLANKIGNGFYKTGEKLPSIAQLCSTYKTSDATIRKSLSMLKDKGFISAVNRIGYFISDSHLPIGMSFHFNENTHLKNSAQSYTIQNISRTSMLDDRPEILKGFCMRIDRLYFYMDILPVYYKIFYLPIHAKMKDYENNIDRLCKEMDDIMESHFMEKRIVFTIDPNPEFKKRLYIPPTQTMIKVEKTYNSSNDILSGLSIIYISAKEIDISFNAK